MRAEDFLKNENGEKQDKNKFDLNKMMEIINFNILKECIDVRMFGSTIPIEKDDKHKDSITHTGAVQFKMGVSLHKVDPMFIKGTGAFASGKEKAQATFREEWILPYSLITFYGIINENAAKTTNLTEADVDLLIDGIWNGTKNLISRSKVGQTPRLLMQVVYKENNYHIGELDKRISIVSDKRDEAIRDISELKLDVTNLVNILKVNQDKIERIRIKVDERMNFIKNSESINLQNVLKNSGFNIE